MEAAPPRSVPPVVASTPLPPPDAPVLASYEALAERARSGDARAARRMADDLSACAELERDLRIAERMIDGPGRGRGNPPPAGDEGEAFRLDMIDRRLAQLQDKERRCAGITAEQSLSAGEWVRLAAIHGDAEARLCYALAPNEWNRSLMTPQWMEWSTRWQSEAPTQLKLALEAGLPEAAAALSQMYTPWSPLDGRPWDGVLGDDPHWAYAYALIAQNVLGPASTTRWADVLSQHTRRLAPAQVAAAQSWAAATQAQIAFLAPAVAPQRDASLCSRIRAAGGR